MSKYEYQDSGGKESEFDLMRFEIYVNTIKPHLPSKKASILDVGCATGRLLSLFKESGYENVKGLDPSPVCSEVAAKLYGIFVQTGNLWDLETYQDTFDCIILSGVLEHIRDLNRTLSKLASMLSVDGLVFIDVPDAALTATRPAITAARNTDGSPRVSSTNHARIISTAMNRLLRRNRCNNGDKAANR